MSRPSALRATLDLPPDHALEVVSVSASGDCFYDCVRELLLRHHRNRRDSLDVVEPASSPLSRGLRDGSSSSAAADGGTGDAGAVEAEGAAAEFVPSSSQSMRDYVAERLTSEQLDLYRMCAAAGLDEYEFSTDRTLEELKKFARRSGRTNGPGRCFWADEFALRTISDWLGLTLLIVDDQASRGGAGRKRRRGEGGNDGGSPRKGDGRFVAIGSHPRGVVLHRSRRQHYNAVVVDSSPVIELDRLPPRMRSLWPVVQRSDRSDSERELSSKSYTNDDNPTNGQEKTNECNLEEGEKKTCSGHVDSTSQKSLPSDTPEGNESASSLHSTSSSSPPTQPLGNFYCGCAGFSSSSWVGNFYPRSLVGGDTGRQLDHYQQHFRAVEINSTFYGIPTELTVKKWKRAFAKSFRVSAKAPRGLTHEGPRLGGSALAAFLSRMRPLGQTLACVLVQCPRSLEVTVSQLEGIKQMVDEEASWYEGHIVFEFRNPATYHDGEVRRFLKQNGFGLAMHPNSLGRSTVGTSAGGRGISDLEEYSPEPLSKVAAEGAVISALVYLRLHGSNDEHRGEYSAVQLRDIAGQIHKWRERGLEVYCFFLNDLEPAKSPSTSSTRKSASSPPWDGWCAMPKNAKQLESLVFGMSNDVTPDAPKKPKSTLLNFFGKKKGA